MFSPSEEQEEEPDSTYQTLTDATPHIGKINLFTKIYLKCKLCNLDVLWNLECSKHGLHGLFYDLKHHL